MAGLAGKVAWITGASSGIGEAAAQALAADGATVVLTARRAEALDGVATTLRAGGGTAHVKPGDVTKAAEMQAVAGWIAASLGRIDILVNNAGMNVRARTFAQLTAEGADEVIATNLNAAFYCVSAVLPTMRAQRDGVLIHTSSWAGRHLGTVSGAAYSAAKHGVVAMSHLLNAEECVNGIRSCAICPAEVATPILDRRPVPVSAEERARMLQPADLGDLVRYVATLPAHVCLNEVVISPTWNRTFAAVGAASR